MAPSTRKRQARITFTPIPSSDPAAQGYNKQIQDRAAVVGYGNSSQSSKRRKRSAPASQADENDASFHDSTTNTNTMLPTPANEGQQIRSDPTRSSSRKKSKKRRAKQQRLDFGPESSNGRVNADPPVAPNMFTQARGQKRSRGEESSEDSDEITVRGGSKKRKMGFMSSGGKGSSQDKDEDEIVLPSARKKARPVPDKAPAVDDDSEDDMPTTLGTQKRRRKERESSFISSSPPAETAGSEDDLQIIDDPNRAPAQQDDSDDDEELARSDVDENRPPRDSQTLKKNARQQALERLKQARSSQPSLPDIQEDEDVAMQDQRELDEMYDNSEESPEPERVSRRAMFDADEDDEDFIEEGDDDVLGVPEGIPLKYTRYASMKAKDLWKFAIEWMVQKKINPAFAMDDEIYTLTFQKLDDEVSGLAGSKFMSSAWNAEFTSAVRSRPAIEP
ncbi:hypothetical protein L1887_63011 [Cichorium endivia]|nr:hypothetical protein L1887_63011 [Cichorium endivia]